MRWPILVCLLGWILACGGGEVPIESTFYDFGGRRYEARERCVYEGFDETKICTVELFDADVGAPLGKVRFDKLDSCCCDRDFEEVEGQILYRVRKRADCGDGGPVVEEVVLR